MKRTVFVMFSVLCAVLICVSASALTLDCTEAEAEMNASSAVLAEETVTVIPGLNLLTGTTEAESFETEGMQVPNSIFHFNGVSKANIGTEYVYSGSKALECISAGTYPRVNLQTPIEKGRKYYMEAKAMASSEWNDYIWWVCQDDTSNSQVVLSTVSGFRENSAKGVWTSHSATYTANSTNIFYFQNKTATGNVYHFDDIKLVPYYKVTYIGLDGETVVATEQVLIDANGEMMKFYIPDVTKVDGATGYSLTKGGERVLEVALENNDIVLYALDTPVVTLAYGKNSTAYTVESETFTFPAAEDVFEGIENFFVYSNGAKYYKAGETVAASEVIGSTFTAVCTTHKAFDENYGELILIVDYDLAGVNTVIGSAPGSGAIMPSYKNNAFIADGVSRTDGNGIKGAAVVEIDGNRVLKLTTRNSSVHNYWCMVYKTTVPGKYTAFETAKAEDTQGIANIASLFGTPWHRFGFPGGSKQAGLETLTDAWKTQSHTYEVSAAGITTSGFSYTRADNNKLPNIYKDDYVAYVYPKNTIYFESTADANDYKSVVVDVTATTFTFPTAEELGYAEENFAGWTNGSKHFMAGEKVELSKAAYTVYHPYYQVADAPAMGFTFEGNKKESSVEVGGPIYTKNIIDDGRDVLLVHAWNGKKGEGTYFPSDSRLSFKTSTRSDPSEYNILQYSVKLGDMWAVTKDGNVVTGYKLTPTQNITVHAHTTAGGTYTNPVITCISQTLTTSDNYNIVEKDMSGNANFTSKAGYGFCIEPCKATYGYYVYMDYFRVYRKGIQTINYNTNAPEGAKVVKEVASDKNRGLGYGYLLKDERPSVEGYVFLGWGLTPDATETVNSITVDGNETVYAVWAKAETIDTPEVTEEVEIRGNGENNDTNGIRFKSEIKPSVKKNLDEFGFLATREVLLPYADEEKTTRNYDYLTFNHKVNGADANYYAQGIAYDADGEIDMENGNNADGSIVYTAVVSGIPLEKKEEKMVVRSYAKYTVNGKEMVAYGNTNAASLYDVASAIATDKESDAYKNNQSYIDEILG